VLAVLTSVSFFYWKWRQTGYPRWIYDGPQTCYPVWHCIIIDPDPFEPIETATTSVSTETIKTTPIQPNEFIETKIVNIIPQDNFGTQNSYIYHIGDKDKIITLAFSHEISGKETLDNFERYFDYANFNVQFPEKQVAGHSIPTAWGSNLKNNEVGKIIFTSYENGRLKGNLKTNLKKVSYGVTSSDPDCITDDISGYCFKNIPVNINLEINFDFKLK